MAPNTVASTTATTSGELKLIHDTARMSHE